ncbi:hypothetical protein G4B88_002730 [Cannabis sativa]|uniref:Reverse transcriptase zinc-binding domain-containing protein n=1 Tax=Cannabis sativa TaxID=3483 RepID=A0A7J6HHV0_CANSA|nr:hypothetical protein G4B88_002730 [Cannabis sativa]
MDPVFPLTRMRTGRHFKSYQLDEWNLIKNGASNDLLARSVELFQSDSLLIISSSKDEDNKDSVLAIQDALSIFSACTDLRANLEKSHINLRGIYDNEKIGILGTVNFCEGSFSLKYPGVPMCPTKWQDDVKEVDKLYRDVVWGTRDCWDYDLKVNILAGGSLGKFSTNTIYNKFLIDSERMENNSVVWNKFSTPKHQFVLCQALHNHLLTRDNLISRGVGIVSLPCLVYHEGVDYSHAHLFFYCVYSKLVLKRVRTWLSTTMVFKTPLGGHHSSPPSQASPDTKEEIDRSLISRAPSQSLVFSLFDVFRSGCGVLFGSEKEVSVMILVCRCGFGGVGSSIVVGSGGLGGGRVVWAE